MARESLWTMKDYKKSIMQGILLLAMFAVVLFAEWRDFQLDRIENEKKISDNTVLFVCGFPGIDARMDFTDNEITKEEYASDTPQTAQQDTQYDRQRGMNTFQMFLSAYGGNGLLRRNGLTIFTAGMRI